MELIPILSTIILVATISTFILAVGAYILYKIRESKIPYVVTERKIQSAELVQPVEVQTSSVKTEHERQDHAFKQRTGDVNISVQQVPYSKPDSGRTTSDYREEHKVVIPVNKYSKYSQEEYIPSNGDGKEKVLKWR
jgi:hypothetical protein